jgi:cytidylate kinase
MIVAVDGPAASGKGTLARRLAAELGLAYLDTGKIYRAVGYRVLSGGGDPADPELAQEAARALDESDLANPALSSDDAADAASKVAAIPPVRDILLAFQQNFAARPEGAVLDGRDIGTVVCPNADVKLFVTADVEVRAERRHKELLDRGEASIYARVLQALADRDARDRGRSAAPMLAASDAVIIDTTSMNAEEAFNTAISIVRSRVG